jgi:ribulose kinase
MVKFYTQDLAEKESWLSELQKAINTIVKENKVRKGIVTPSSLSALCSLLLCEMLSSCG